ncbi:MAG: hypothetical protein IPG09_16055 [Ignavibacteria bacterium]|nr:hypothetical protein [Ignavibacteria bacterium]
MKTKLKSIVTALFLITTLISCNKTTQNTQTTVKNDTISKSAAPLVEKVLTAEQQAALTPDVVLQSLKDGNKRFMNNQITARDHSAMVRNSAIEKTSKDKNYVDEVGRNNVLNAIEMIKTKSPVLEEMLAKKEIRIVGGYYDMTTGEVKFME